MLSFEKFFYRVENLNSPELDRVSTGISALWIRIPRKNCGVRWVGLVTAWRRLAIYSCLLCTVWLSRRVKCLD